jgi:peptide/nickel transport system permease protein
MNPALWRYIALRLVVIPPVLLGTSIVTFAVTHLLGNPVYLLLGPTATPQAVKSTTEKLLLDRPLWEQYLRYLQGSHAAIWANRGSRVDRCFKTWPSVFQLLFS